MWEYKVKDIGADETLNEKGQEVLLNEMGKKGWELVCIQGEFAYFRKRKVGEFSVKTGVTKA